MQPSIEELLDSFSNILANYHENGQETINWSEEHRQTALAFLSSPLQLTVYVSIYRGTYAISWDFPTSQSEFDHVVIILKLPGHLECSKPLLNQVNVVNIPGTLAEQDIGGKRAYEHIQNIISSVVVPYFDFTAQNTPEGSANSIAQVSIGTKKKLNELAISLAYLQQRVEVPNLLSSIPESLKLILKDSNSPLNANVTSDTAILNELTRIVNGWIRQIQSTTTIAANYTEIMSLLEQVQFWKSLEAGLLSLHAQTTLPEVKTAIEILNSAKRFQVSVAFKSNLNLEDLLSEIRAFNALLRDLPIEEIVYKKETHLDLKIYDSTLDSLFLKLKRWRGLNLLPTMRMLNLMDQIVDEIASYFAQLCLSLDLFFLPKRKFDLCLNTELLPSLLNIEGNLKFMENIFREQIRKRQETFFVAKIRLNPLVDLKTRLLQIKDVRQSYDQLQSMLCYFGESSSISDELTNAYCKYCAAAPAFVFSKEGKSKWTLDQRLYQQSQHNLERHISTLIHRTLDDCQDINDLYSAFTRFKNEDSNVLPFLIALVDENHKIKVLDIVQSDLMKFRNTTDSLRLLSRQPYERIQHELSCRSKFVFYTDFLDTILGPNWRKFSIGVNISEDLKTTALSKELENSFNIWLQSAGCVNSHLNSETPILRIDLKKNYSESDILLNDDHEIYSILKQALVLLNENFVFPVSSIASFDRLSTAEPYVRVLTEHLHLFKLTLSSLSTKSAFIKYDYLVQDRIKNCSSALEGVMQFSWAQFHQGVSLVTNKDSSKSLPPCLQAVREFQESVCLLNTQVNILLKSVEFFSNECIAKLSTCSADSDSLSRVLNLFQAELGHLKREDFVGFELFVEDLNFAISKVLEDKCENQLKEFINELWWSSSTIRVAAVHEIRLEGEEITIEPSLELVKLSWIDRLNSIIELFSNIKRLSNGKVSPTVFFDSSQQLLTMTLDTLIQIDNLYLDVVDYWSLWTEFYQIRRKDSSALLGDGQGSIECINDWLQDSLRLLNYVKVFDHPNGKFTVRNAVQFDFFKIQSRALLHFREFQQNLLREVMKRLHNFGLTTYNDLMNAERFLENESGLEANSSSILSDLLSIFEFEKSAESWTSFGTAYARGQSLLSKHGQLFAESWVFAEQLESKLSNIKALLAVREAFIKSHSDIIVLKIRTELKATEAAITNLCLDWKTQKPISYDLEPYEALRVLLKFQSILEELNGRLVLLKRLSLRFDLRVNFASTDELLEEIISLKRIWSELNEVWDSLVMVKKQLWYATDSSAIKSQLHEVLRKLRACSDEAHLYSALNNLERQIKGHLDKVPIILELKSKSIKERHWKQMFKLVALKDINLNAMEVGDVFSIDFDSFKTTIRSIIEQANGEKNIEDGLKLIEEDWNSIVFETFSFQAKWRLVRNWKKLFDSCQSSLSTLASMKNSLYGKPFENIRESLASNLNDLLLILNVWVEVQSHWIYLHGVFGNNEEMKASLPLESTRFHNLSLEFSALLKRALNVNLVIDVIRIKDMREHLTKLFDSLQNTKKGLLEYLDRQRDLFPRFYFVGNDNLLELLGSSSNISLINKHINLMFTGVNSLIFDLSKTHVIGVLSPQGEVLHLNEELEVKGVRALAEWMTNFELQLKLSLASSITETFAKVTTLDFCSSNSVDSMSDLLKSVPVQSLTIAFQIYFSQKLTNLHDDNAINDLLNQTNAVSSALKSHILSCSNTLQLSKARSLIIDILHHQKILESLLHSSIHERSSLISNLLLYVLDLANERVLDRLKVRHGHFEFAYGFEYQGVTERLSKTDLVQKCFLSMTQAAAQLKGGSPFGPAGTGKTECIKALGHDLGRMVLIFCCDERFEFQSMGRILLGICKVGCWGCFDEFNRLESKILSATSSLIESIGFGRKNCSELIDLNGTSLRVHPETGVFVTMNPDYVGRHELPENLKRHFQAFSMDKPDSVQIAEDLLTSHGFVDSKKLANSLVHFFNNLPNRLSSQSHYDFSLRALKSILNTCGFNKRADTDSNRSELSYMVKALISVVAPRLIKADQEIFETLISENFSDLPAFEHEFVELSEIIVSNLLSQGIKISQKFLTKCLQIAQMQTSHQGFMVLGAAGCGKSTLISLTLHALSIHENVTFETVVIECKTLSKGQLFGFLDHATQEWVDGLFTKTLRRVLQDLKGEQNKRIWIVFDCDIDPEWAENLNSVLDDNKILTLPNGERLKLPPNVRIIFEADSLKAATPAIISRCGMVWVEESLIERTELLQKLVHDFKVSRIQRYESAEDLLQLEQAKLFYEAVTKTVLAVLTDSFLMELEAKSSQMHHIMQFMASRSLSAVFSFLHIYCDKIEDDLKIPNFVFSFVTFSEKALLLALTWAYSGDCLTEDRVELSSWLCLNDPFDKLNAPPSVINYFFDEITLDWCSWASTVEEIDLEPYHVLDPSIVIPNLDTVVQEYVIRGALINHLPLILCGPPGSGKTMILLRSLRNLADFDFISLNFSKDTTSNTIISALEQHCEYKDTISGSVLAPKIDGKWVVVFCDEINLPSLDKFGTQKTVSFLRQLVELSGFWHPRSLQWVSIRNIQFVGACNDPSDPGRNPLTQRFLRHATVFMIDHPSEEAMRQIYNTFNLASLKCAPGLRHFTSAMTNAMLEVYESSRKTLGSDIKQHYIYSPRELTRWARGILNALMAYKYDEVEELLKLWFHEALRLFHDRLVDAKSKTWCRSLLLDTVEKYFPIPGIRNTLDIPLFFTSWLSGKYQLLNELDLLKFVNERMRVFCEEEMNSKLVLYQDLLDHVLRIDRVLRQAQGHLMLVGSSASGKSTLVKFVSWMNGLKVVQLRVHSGYTILEFEFTLRNLLISCAKGTKVCFLIDESSILKASFIERINSLLANSEIPGLFEGEDLENLHSICSNESATQGIMLESSAELHGWFTKQVSENLHVVFTVSDMSSDKTSNFQTSPALFNRCVINWIGDWSINSLQEVAQSHLSEIPLDQSDYTIPPPIAEFADHKVETFREAVTECLITIHKSAASWKHLRYPSKFLQLLKISVELFIKGQMELEKNQRCISVGIEKLKETALDVTKSEELLIIKKEALASKVEKAKKMLNQMILDQNEAERKKEFSEDAQIEIQNQEHEILARRDIVIKNLEAVEPAVLEAQRGVQNIKKQHLTEIRSMSNPPAAVKMTMESVCILLGYQVSTWREVQLIVRKDDFITSIVNYDSEQHLTTLMKDHMEKHYLARDDYNFETVNRASQACGPLVLWVIAQLRYFSILEKVKPLCVEVTLLEESATKSKARLIAIAQMIEELESSIEKYKNDYSELIGQVEVAKTELSNIEQKVARSKLLMVNLTSERERWQRNAKSFRQFREVLAGNSILGAAFATYCGGLSSKARGSLVLTWKGILKKYEVPFDHSLHLASLLAPPSEGKNGQLNSDILIENLAIKAWGTNTLLVDPSGDFDVYMKELDQANSIRKVSFLDETFLRTLDDVLRFGGDILLQNAECYDPVMDSWIRNEIIHRGGQRTLHLGDKITVLLGICNVTFYTKDERCALLSFLEARVTMLNFGVSEENLENSVLNSVLSHFRPDLFKKRSAITSLQSEYQQKTLKLRQKLLDILNECQDKILESNDVVDSLHKLKLDSTEIDDKLAEASATLQEVDKERSRYEIVVKHVQSIYLVISKISKLEAFYNVSFELFFKTFEASLMSFKDDSEMDSMIKCLYLEVLKRYAPCFRKLDRLSFVVSLATAFCGVQFGQYAKHSIIVALRFLSAGWEEESCLQYFNDNLQGVSQNYTRENWRSILKESQNKQFLAFIAPLIDCSYGTGSSSRHALSAFCESIFGAIVQTRFETFSICNEWSSPVLISISKRYACSSWIQTAARDSQSELVDISMGSEESVKAAIKAISNASLHGGWVLLQNIQMSPTWLVRLEKLLEKLKSHKNFRLFMTCSLNSSNIPNDLIHMSHVVTIEEQSDFKTTFRTIFDGLASESFTDLQNYVCALLGLYSTIIQDRLKYSPFSFTQDYDINDSDVEAAAFMIAKIYEDTNTIPWTEISFKIGEVLFGGKMSVETDVKYCSELAKRIFSANSLKPDFNLVENPIASRLEVFLHPPSDKSISGIKRWISAIPDPIPMAYIGLEEEVLKEIEESEAQQVIEKSLGLLIEKQVISEEI